MVGTISDQASLTQARSGRLCWLHLSDIHFWRKNDWSDDTARRKLITFLQNGLNDGTLPRPNLVFCTGDIAMGETAPNELAVQYDSAQAFFDEVLKVCGLPITRLFVVPGNHDVNRSVVSRNAQKGLRQATLEEIKKDWAGQTVEYRDAIKRLYEYGQFVKKYLPHQLDEHGRHCYTRVVNVNGVRIGIGGFNSAWTCYDNDDKSQLWLAGEWQFNAADTAFADKTDFCVGLMHHPASWFTAAEESLVKKQIRAGFQFWLHGHEHDAWVTPTDREIVICAGAVNAHSDDEFGINLVQLDLTAGAGHVQQFSYKTAGNAWLICPSEDAPNAVRPIKFAPISPNVWPENDTITPQDPEPAPTQAKPTKAGGVLAKLAGTIGDALTASEAAVFKAKLCCELGLPPAVAVSNLINALEALPGLDAQMFVVQKALLDLTITPSADEEQHPIERAARGLTMHAAINAVNIEAYQATGLHSSTVSDVPEKCEIAIAVLMAAMTGELHQFNLIDSTGAGQPKAPIPKGQALFDADQLPFDPFRDHVTFTNEIAKLVDKTHQPDEITTLANDPEQWAKFQRKIKLMVAQQRIVFSNHFRVIGSENVKTGLQNKAFCEELVNALGVPITRISTNGKMSFKTILGITADELEILFGMLLNLLNQMRKN